jgi:hypothetical protein
MLMDPVPRVAFSLRVERGSSLPYLYSLWCHVEVV